MALREVHWLANGVELLDHCFRHLYLVSSFRLVSKVADGLFSVSTRGSPAGAPAVPPIDEPAISFSSSPVAASSFAAALSAHPVGAVEDKS